MIEIHSSTELIRVVNCNQIYYLRGGSEKYMFDLESLLKSKGHHCVPFAGVHEKNRKSLHDKYFPQAINLDQPSISNLPSYFYNKDAAKKIRNLVEQEQINLAHIHLFYGRLTASALRVFQRKQIPIVQTLHDFKPLCPISNFYRNNKSCEECPKHGNWRVIANRCNRGSLIRSTISFVESNFTHLMGHPKMVTRFISPSIYLRNKFIEYGFDEKQIVHIPNFVPSYLQEAKAPGDYYLYVGRLEEYKGVWLLVKAFAEANLPLKIAGTGTLLEPLKKYIAELGIKNISILGFVDPSKVPELIQSAYMTVAPSIWPENFPYSILESLANGVPVIGANTGGIPELVIPGKTGLLFPVGNLQSLIDAIRHSAQHQSEILSFRERSIKEVIENYTPEAHYRRISSLYSEVV